MLETQVACRRTNWTDEAIACFAAMRSYDRDHCYAKLATGQRKALDSSWAHVIELKEAELEASKAELERAEREAAGY